jgi:hypothetical protein
MQIIPIEAEIHLKALTLFGNITRAEKPTVEWHIAERQLHIKTTKVTVGSLKSKSFAPITPTAHYSDNPLFRQPIFPTANNLAQQRIFFMTSEPGKQTTIDKTIDSKSCRPVYDYRQGQTQAEAWP